MTAQVLYLIAMNSCLPDFGELGRLEMSRTLGGVNTEVRALVLGAMPPGQGVRQCDIHHTIMSEANGSRLHAASPNMLGDIAEKMPEGLVTVERDEARDERVFIKTESGHIATALGGILLHNSLRSNVPIRVLAGERRRVPDLPSSSATLRDSLDIRLAVLSGLYDTATERWVGTLGLNQVFEERGAGVNATRNHLPSLTAGGLVESKKVRQKGRDIRKYRIAPDDEIVKPVVVIEEYLEAVASFAANDEAAISRGHALMAKVLSNKEHVPFLVRRSYTSSKHTGKSTKHRS